MLIEAAGQRYTQTDNFFYLNSLINDIGCELRRQDEDIWAMASSYMTLD